MNDRAGGNRTSKFGHVLYLSPSITPISGDPTCFNPSQLLSHFLRDLHLPRPKREQMDEMVGITLVGETILDVPGMAIIEVVRACAPISVPPYELEGADME